MAERQDGSVARAVKLRFWSEADGRMVVAAWRRSEQTQAAFARSHGISAQRLSWWIRRVERGQPGRLLFHPVRVPSTSQVERNDDGRIEIRLGDGRSVHVPAGFAPEALEQVLDVLEAR